MTKIKGVTIIELLIVLTIISILATIAIPVYNDQMTKARRTDGQIAILDLAARMERYYAENHTFTSATIASGNGITEVLSSTQSLEGHYTLSIVSQSDTDFLIQASPNGIQATKDIKCGTLRINQLGQKSITGTGTVKTCWG